MSAPIMSPTPEREPERPAALRRRPQVLALVAIVIATIVPLALAFGFPICDVLGGVGVHLDACAEPALPAVDPTPPPLPAPPPDGGRGE